MSKLLFVFLFTLSSLSFAGAPPPGASTSFGRGTVHTEEVIFFIGAVVIFIVISFFLGSAWEGQDNNKQDDRP